jgi:hypothetical protein
MFVPQEHYFLWKGHSNENILYLRSSHLHLDRDTKQENKVASRGAGYGGTQLYSSAWEALWCNCACLCICVCVWVWHVSCISVAKGDLSVCMICCWHLCANERLRP